MDNLSSIDSKSSQLCMACGLCCQGILFYQQADPQPFGISPEPTDPLLPLACRLYSFTHNSCRIYEDPQRPDICQTYQCRLLKKVQQGEISLEQAQTRIKNLRTLLAKILTQIPQSDPPILSIRLTQRAFDALKLELARGDRSHLELYMDIAWFWESLP